ncbi:MAG: hypothetical protein ABH832_03425 [bacterium]
MEHWIWAADITDHSSLGTMLIVSIDVNDGNNDLIEYSKKLLKKLLTLCPISW